MKTEQQLKDIIRYLNGKVIEHKNDALDNLYKGNEVEVVRMLGELQQLRYGIELLQYILDDNCVLGEDY